MSTVNSDQTHLDTDIAAIQANHQTVVNNFVTVIAELKNQPGAEQLDFTKADALVAQTQTDATTTTSEVPPPTTQAATGVLATGAPTAPVTTNPPAPPVEGPVS